MKNIFIYIFVLKACVNSDSAVALLKTNISVFFSVTSSANKNKNNKSSLQPKKNRCNDNS